MLGREQDLRLEEDYDLVIVWWLVFFTLFGLSFVLPICFGFNRHSAELITRFLEAHTNDIFASVTFSL